MDLQKTQELKFAGRYRILEEIGSGGMGKVYKAFDDKLNRIVALKIILTSKSDKGSALARFLREVQSTALLRHPNIICLYDMGEAEGRYYFTMEYIQGHSLEALIQKKKRLTGKKTAEIMKQVADAVHYAHTQHIIHRDLKPANIMIRETGEPVVMDFGIAKITTHGTKLTQDGSVVGTLNYISPEQAEGKSDEVDERSDVYSLGAILYQAITGSVPHQGETSAEILTRIFNDEPKKPSDYSKVISKELEAICLKAMEKKKERRYRNAEQLSDDLQRYLAGNEVSAKPDSSISRLKKKAVKHKVVFLSNLVVIALCALVMFFSGVFDRIPEPKIQSQKPDAPSVKPVPKEEHRPQPPSPSGLPKGIWAWMRCEGPEVKLEKIGINHQKIFYYQPYQSLVLKVPQESQIFFEFQFPQIPQKVMLRLVHLTSAYNPQKPGYSPIHICVNKHVLVDCHDPGDMNHVSQEFDMSGMVVMGKNEIHIQLTEKAITGYWLKSLEIVVVE